MKHVHKLDIGATDAFPTNAFAASATSAWGCRLKKTQSQDEMFCPKRYKLIASK